MGNIFDGIQRPLKQIAADSASCFIPRGVDVPALDRSLQWEFEPTKFKVGSHRVSGGHGKAVLLEASCGRLWLHPVLPLATLPRPVPLPPAPLLLARRAHLRPSPCPLPRRWATASPAATSTAWCTRTR